MVNILDLISKIGTFFVIFSLLYFLFKYILSRFIKTEIVIFNKLYLNDLISLTLSFIIILNFVTITSPYL